MPPRWICGRGGHFLGGAQRRILVLVLCSSLLIAMASNLLFVKQTAADKRRPMAL